MEKRCADCRNGEHGDYDDKIMLVVVRDPGTMRLIRRAYMCEEHRRMYNNDGYQVIIK